MRSAIRIRNRNRIRIKIKNRNGIRIRIETRIKRRIRRKREALQPDRLPPDVRRAGGAAVRQVGDPEGKFIGRSLKATCLQLVCAKASWHLISCWICLSLHDLLLFENSTLLHRSLPHVSTFYPAGWTPLQ